jgi:hypothetical protein
MRGRVPGRVPGRVRGLVARRSPTQRLGAVAALVVVLSAPFGGWRSAADQEVVPLALDQRLDLGPFHLTIDSVEQVTALPPVLEADPDARYLVIRTTVTNHTDRAESVTLAEAAFSGDHTGFLAWPDEEAQLRVYGVDDAVRLPSGEFVNPGNTLHLAFVLRQQPDTDLAALTLGVRGYHFQEVDPQTLDPDRWVLDETPIAEGHLPVEVDA